MSVKEPPDRGLLLFYGVVLANIFNIKTGHVLICDFERGFVPPEMVKSRPVVVISRSSTHYSGLCTIVPLSTTRPTKIELWHVRLTQHPIPHMDSGDPVWAKCDMIYTVSHARLSRHHKKISGKREYLTAKVSTEDLAAIFNGLRAYLPSEK